MIKSSNTLIEITSVHHRDIGVKILKCQTKKRENENWHLIPTNNIKLIWRRKDV